MERKLVANYLVPENVRTSSIDEVWVSPATWDEPFGLKVNSSTHEICPSCNGTGKANGNTLPGNLHPCEDCQ